MFLSFITTAQFDFGTYQVDVSTWNNYKKAFDYQFTESETTIFSFEDDLTVFKVKGYADIHFITADIKVEGKKMIFTGIDSNLETAYIVIDYDYNLIKIVIDIKGVTTLLSFYISTQLENNK